MTVYVRTLQNQEAELWQAIEQARSVPMQLVQRACLVLRSSEGMKAAAIATKVGLNVDRVREWIKRFNAWGLFDQPRSGRPREYEAEQALQGVEVATTSPAELVHQSIAGRCATGSTTWPTQRRSGGCVVRRSGVCCTSRASATRWRSAGRSRPTRRLRRREKRLLVAISSRRPKR
jgi:hypothetical protein